MKDDKQKASLLENMDSVNYFINSNNAIINGLLSHTENEETVFALKLARNINEVLGDLRSELYHFDIVKEINNGLNNISILNKNIIDSGAKEKGE